MKLFDKIYLNLYWCGNKGRGGGIMFSSEIDKLIMISTWGLIMFLLTIVFTLISIDIKLGGLLLLSGIASFFVSNLVMKKYFTEEKCNQIIKENKEPGFWKYIILIATPLIGLGLTILGIILSMMVYHRFLSN